MQQDANLSIITSKGATSIRSYLPRGQKPVNSILHPVVGLHSVQVRNNLKGWADCCVRCFPSAFPGSAGVETWLGSTRRTPRTQGAIKKGRLLGVAWSSIRSFVAPSVLQEYGTAYGVSLRNANVTTSFHFRTGGCRVQHEMVGRNSYSSLPVTRSPKWFSRELWRTTLSWSIPINRDRLGYSHHCDIWGAYLWLAAR